MTVHAGVARAQRCNWWFSLHLQGVQQKWGRFLIADIFKTPKPICMIYVNNK